MYDEIVTPICRYPAVADVTSNRNIQYYPPFLKPSRSLRLPAFHDRPAINVPNQSSTLLCPVYRLIPRKAIYVATRAIQVWQRGLNNAMLIPILTVVVAPVQAGMVGLLAVPRLHDIDLSVRRPSARLFRQHPEGGPDARRGRRRYPRLEVSASPRQPLAREQARAGVLVSVACGGYDGADDERVRRRVEGVCRRGHVILHFVVAPAMIAQLMIEVRTYRESWVEVGLPISLWMPWRM